MRVMGQTNKKKWCVYIHISPSNKAYVGITSQKPKRRWKGGYNYSEKSQPAFYHAIQKYGWGNFEHIIFAENVSEQEAKHMEVLLIALYKTNCRRYYNPSYGYNLTDGGDGTCGMHHSEEYKQNMSKRVSGKGNPMYGKTHTNEVKKLLSENGSISVLQLDSNGKILNEYKSEREAEKMSGILGTNIARCCRKKLKSAGGYIWRYKHDYDPQEQFNYTPMTMNRCNITVNSDTLSARQWAQTLSVPYDFILRSIKNYGEEKVVELFLAIMQNPTLKQERRGNQTLFDVYGLIVNENLDTNNTTK